MFQHTPQSGCIPLLHGAANKPLSFWSKQVRSGRIKRRYDADLAALVVELIANNINSTFITCPRNPLITLGIRLPVLVFNIKYIGKYLGVDVQVLDDRQIRRRFRINNLTNSTKARPHVCTIPLKLVDGWNQVQLNLTELTQRAYYSTYVETTRIQLSASCLVRRIYFADKPVACEDDASGDTAAGGWKQQQQQHLSHQSIKCQATASTGQAAGPARSLFHNCPPLSTAR